MILLGLLVGFILMVITKNPIIIGCGIFIGAFFYGVGQPYAYNLTTTVSSQVASSLTMAWLIIMNSIGMLLCPVIVNFVESIFHAKHIPSFPYFFMLILCAIAWVFVLLRGLFKKKKQTKAFIFGQGFVQISSLSPAIQAYVTANPAEGYALSEIEKIINEKTPIKQTPSPAASVNNKPENKETNDSNSQSATNSSSSANTTNKPESTDSSKPSEPSNNPEEPK